jgi:hypothetical protein
MYSKYVLYRPFMLRTGGSVRFFHNYQLFLCEKRYVAENKFIARGLHFFFFQRKERLRERGQEGAVIAEGGRSIGAR